MVFGTNKGFWYSVEKHNEGIDMRRSRNKDEVVYEHIGESQRPNGGKRVIAMDTWGKRKDKQYTIGQLLEFISWQLKNTYNFQDSNCMHFAEAFYLQLGFEYSLSYYHALHAS